MNQITKRLTQGQDLKTEIEKMLAEYDVEAGVILSVVGSLKPAVLRMPVVEFGKPIIRTWDEEFEIVSATGVVSKYGHHIHLSVSNIEGKVYGGHLKPGCLVRTTCELVILKFDDARFKRIKDPQTGYEELVVE